MQSFQGSSFVGAFVFLFLTPSLIYVLIFIENRTFLNFGGVGHGCGSSRGRRTSGPGFLFSSQRICSQYQFSLKTKCYLLFLISFSFIHIDPHWSSRLSFSYLPVFRNLHAEHSLGNDFCDVTLTSALATIARCQMGLRFSPIQRMDDGTQKLCKYCTPDTAVEFPHEDEAIVTYPNDDESGDSTFENAVPWRNVDRNQWLQFKATYHVNTMYGPATIVTLQKRDGVVIKGWAINIIAKAMVAKESVKGEKILFIKSLSLKKGKTIIRIHIIIFN